MPETQLLKVSTPAWILSVNNNFKLALGEGSVEEYLRDSTLYPVPGAVDHCCELLLWRDNFIPVFDLNLLLSGNASANEHIAVVSYQEYSGQVTQHAAIKLDAEVERVSIDDDSACDWPEDYPIAIQPLVESLFTHQAHTVSVLNIADLCNEGYRDYLLQLAQI